MRSRFGTTISITVLLVAGVSGAVGFVSYLSGAATNAPVIARFSALTAKPTAG